MAGRSVRVQDNNVDKALRKLKKKVANSKVLVEVKSRTEYIKPSTQRKLAKGAAKSRWKKYLRQQQLPKKDY